MDILEQRMSRILFEELPRTFRDAVDISRRLGAQYLWIDSLCIIQDDGTYPFIYIKSVGGISLC